ncbi:tetratricopeptide repeat protein [Rhabdochromatium marinum]|uniref:tetratricopeptide repeat protein n=1 Tax=Rhabdochromatium marinum TaxID=48729 RepID=UPI001907A8EE|nr:tetratricopeptide repeat protein [Rhabdochromatium marinum]MBK1650453.1 hypothetical protein [Rhabdochromatium marinum]
MEDNLQKALNDHQAGQLDRAATLYRQVIPHLPQAQCATATYLLGTILFQQGDDDQAEALFRDAIVQNPAVADFSVALGDLLKQTDRHADAGAAYAQALSLNADDSITTVKYADTLFDLGRYEEACQVYARVLHVPTSAVKAYHGYAQALIQLERYEEAIAACQSALSIAPGKPEILNTLGVLLTKRINWTRPWMLLAKRSRLTLPMT